MLLLIGGVTLSAYYFRPKVADVGYSPVQPVPFSHKLHAGNLGMDCRYCHFTVERAAYAALPTTETCMNCHTRVRPASALLAPVRESYASGRPIQWVRVHQLPDYVYFSHQAHVTAGVSCVNCHGRVEQMIEVKQVQPLSMAWCLECHRNPAPAVGAELVAANHINPPANCSGCHR